MKGDFKILIKGDIHSYTEFDDIPEKIGAVVKYLPDYPESPHSEEEHTMMSTFNDKLQQLLERECRQLRE